MEYGTLDMSTLSAEAQRALGSGPGKMMAARGMAPLSNPVDLLSVLYQLCQDPDAKLATAALSSARTLPKNILASALAASHLDPRVIDFFIHKADCRADLLETVVLNQRTSDETVATLAAIADKKQLDLIAENSQRVLRHPEIISALYVNKNARMSTVDRVVELAVRNNVRAPGIPAWDEISASMLHAAKADEPQMDEATMDALFEKAAPESVDEDAPTEKAEEQELQLRDMTVPMKIRLAMMGNKFQRAQLIKDPKKIVAMAVIKSPSVKENEAAKYASNNAICEDVIGYIANKKDWTKLYHIKQALVTNPKCPLPSAMRLLPHLRAKDLQALARSRNVPTALAAQARKLSQVRGGKK
jgi:hypothetical protein